MKYLIISVAHEIINDIINVFAINTNLCLRCSDLVVSELFFLVIQLDKRDYLRDSEHVAERLSLLGLL